MSSAGLKQWKQRKMVEVGHGVRSQGKSGVSFEFINGTLHHHFVKSILVAYFHWRIQSDHSGKQYSG